MLITKRELAAKLAGVKGATFATILTETSPALRGGKSCPLLGLVKFSRTNICLNFKYENAVNNQRKREGEEADFVAEPRRWGSRVLLIDENKRLTPLVIKADTGLFTMDKLLSANPNELYLEAKVERSLEYRYLLNGNEIGLETVKEWLPKQSASRQGVEKEVVLRDYSFSSIREITLRGETYKIIA